MLLLFFGALAPAGASPQAAKADVTFSRDIAPVVYKNCASCHRTGGVGPFTLTSYDDVKKRARLIASVVEKRVMPPWKGETEIGAFVGARRLSDEQIGKIRQWAEAGAAEGASAGATKLPPFNQGWQLGTPDLVVKMAEPYTVPAEGQDIYRAFVIPLDIPPGKFLKAAEFRPGNRSVVHHAELLQEGEGKARKLDALDPGPGFKVSMSGPGERLSGSLGFWTPGKDALPLPDGHSLVWRRGADLVLVLHLSPAGKPVAEQSTIGLHLTSEAPKRGMSPLLIDSNDRINIPPGEKAYRLTASQTLPQETEVLGLFPHMHLLGKEFTAIARTPDGARRTLLRIGDWDFKWQNYYELVSPVRFPPGTRIDVEWVFDNSAENPRNPSRPPKPVHFGEQTTDEMAGFLIDVSSASTAASGDSSPMALDADGDGLLDAAELAAAAGGTKKAREIVKRYDKNGDGKLSADEIPAKGK